MRPTRATPRRMSSTWVGGADEGARRASGSWSRSGIKASTSGDEDQLQPIRSRQHDRTTRMGEETDVWERSAVVGAIWNVPMRPIIEILERWTDEGAAFRLASVVDDQLSPARS